MKLSLLPFLASILSLLLLVDCLNFTVLHTNDIHSLFEGLGPDSHLALAQGHLARMKYLINKIQRLAPTRTLTLDAGDCFEGSLFHLLTISDAYSCESVPPLELTFLSDAGYDATMFGNHDFDAYEEGLLKILSCANITTTVPILSNNIELNLEDPTCQGFHSMQAQPSNEYTLPSNYKRPTQKTKILPHVLKLIKDEETNETVKVAVIGFHGPDSAGLSYPYRYNDATEKPDAKAYVDWIYNAVTEIKNTHKPDVVIMLSHSGNDEDFDIITSINNMTPPEQQPLVNLHISSHTHFLYKREAGNTTLYQVYAYGSILGVLQLDFDGKNLKVLNYNKTIPEVVYTDGITASTLLPTHINITSDIPMDEVYFKKIEKYTKLIDSAFFENFEYKYSTFLGQVPTNYNATYNFYNYVCDCVQKKLNDFVKPNPPIHAFFMSQSGIRSDPGYMTSVNATSFPFQFSDVYRALSIGTLNKDISNNLLPGDPVVHFYFNHTEFVNWIKWATIIGVVDSDFAITFADTVQYQVSNTSGDVEISNVTISGVPLEKFSKYIHTGMPGWILKFYVEIGQSNSTNGLVTGKFRNEFGLFMNLPYYTEYHEYELLAACIRENNEKQ
ncbi:hypothetical protein AKO1_009221 [Acrasis kona]|uniref:Calcineurin-like phosphoesterase domain-containing protein n=1 Tax=Acrasis kona TaxID=1008807 RepID=A0AAW2ZIY7_9EUKA